ncbi:uncharacterized protein LOC135707104 [Ochlerotatus camptorhynchus]|uniref:uncharacterized protein LOC135707104 n=1 Tax=Ochlerotatus camptorhynchus TaxID=644619 RepID=UPI0031D9130E
MTLKEKLQFVNSKRLCSNCLKSGHWVRECSSKFSCRDCGKKHNSLIHPGFPLSNGGGSSSQSSGKSMKKADGKVLSSNLVTNDEESEQEDAEQREAVGTYNVGTKRGTTSSVFLSTVVLVVRDQNGGKHLARALLDNGSQVSIMSERLCQILSLKRRAVNVPICGIEQAETRARFLVKTAISSRIKDFSIGVEFLILQKVTSELPSVHVSTAHWNIPGDTQLADPEFNTSSRIDLLIGAEHFYRFLSEREVKRISLGTGLPVLIDTVFRWIVTGKVSDTYNNPVSCLISAAPDNLEILLQKFWEIESNEDQPAWSKEERDCEEHFVKTVSRTEEGRYVVHLPKHVNFAQMLGDSRAMALTRFLRLEKQLERTLEMRKQYNTFMQEYLDLGHMREVREDELRGRIMR